MGLGHVHGFVGQQLQLDRQGRHRSIRREHSLCHRGQLGNGRDRTSGWNHRARRGHGFWWYIRSGHRRHFGFQWEPKSMPRMAFQLCSPLSGGDSMRLLMPGIWRRKRQQHGIRRQGRNSGCRRCLFEQQQRVLLRFQRRHRRCGQNMRPGERLQTGGLSHLLWRNLPGRSGKVVLVHLPDSVLHRPGLSQVLLLGSRGRQEYQRWRNHRSAMREWPV
jgi:hypothetical protein